MSEARDPRDVILQAHTPVVPVPRFGALEPLEKAGHRYLVADDGLWLEVRRAWLHAIVPLAPLWGEYAADLAHALPFGRVERKIDYALRAQDLEHLQRRFLVDAAAAMPNEFAAWGVYDGATGELAYRPLIVIDAGPDGVKFHRPTLGPDEHLAVDLHSHASMDAFFSSTDDEDDRGEVKVAVVVGRVHLEPMWASRLCLLGIFVGPETEGAEVQRCRICGCTDERACPGGCEWIEPDLCSRCEAA
jgi:PRTRC genetic system protein A